MTKMIICTVMAFVLVGMAARLSAKDSFVKDRTLTGVCVQKPIGYIVTAQTCGCKAILAKDEELSQFNVRFLELCEYAIHRAVIGIQQSGTLLPINSLA
ncbi:MAG: hypothetical protein H6765_05190 [Candidatus Peribacteria bacterium]|nr:MAG: hypothetical protein H6765_05190 [Candidatus Peribacteria bacterium]